MMYELGSLSDVYTLDFDDIIDVRSPSEFAEDHVPGAINLPVLSDVQRAEVGTIYKQVSPFMARKLGAALIAQNAAHHLQTYFADFDGRYRPLLYCWRGGQRSESLAIILKQIGWRVQLVDGGYKSYRRHVVAALYDTPVQSPVILLDGPTGTAKTDILKRLAVSGMQIIDLEGLANHRGSLFGHWDMPQPSQKAFESRLAKALLALDPAKPVIIEAESNRVGDCRIPPQLWSAMTTAPRIRLNAPIAARAEYLTRAYHDLIADTDRMQDILNRLRPYHAAKTIEEWQDLAVTGQYTALAQDLMEAHYDPRYAKYQAPHVEQLQLADLTNETLDRAAINVANLSNRLASVKPT
jgi:tRNA 2-selenouridine synthase